MISLFLQGIHPVLPVVVILIAAAACFFVSWWSYSHLSSVPRRKRFTLITLRGSAFLILLFLLLNPFLVREIHEEQAPSIAVYLDNSESMTVNRGEYQGLDSYRDILSRFREHKDDRFSYDYYLFDEDVTSGDEISGTGTSTHLHNVMQHMRENEAGYTAAVLFSDGIVTSGRNPVYAAYDLGIPLVAVPVGDTASVRDIAVSDVDYSEPVYTHTSVRFSATIIQDGFEESDVPIRFLQNGEQLDNETLSFTSSSSSHLVEFDHQFTEPGFYSMAISVPPQDGEFTDQNNRAEFTVEVLDDKLRILSLSFEIHPDVRAVRHLAATDQQVELTSSTWLGDRRFSGTDPADLEEDPDLILLHGLPPEDSATAHWLSQSEAPLVWLATPSSFSRLDGTLAEDLLPYRLENRSALLDIHLVRPDDRSHALLDLPGSVLNRFPTLQTYRGNYSVSPLTETLLTAEFQRTETDIPVLLAMETGNRRVTAVNAFGWYRYALSGQDEARNFFTQLFTNLISWTSTSPDERNLTLEPLKTPFSENEPVELRASLLNERGEPEPNGRIELRFFQEEDEDEPGVFRMSHTGGGQYQASAGTWPQGIYRAEASATVAGREIGTAETRVEVSRSNIELIDTRRDDAMLQQLASVTGGLFLDQTEEFTAFLDGQELYQTTEDRYSEIRFLYHSPVWFVLLILLLSGEWLLRRSLSLP